MATLGRFPSDTDEHINHRLNYIWGCSANGYVEGCNVNNQSLENKTKKLCWKKLFRRFDKLTANQIIEKSPDTVN